jgi:hypothetical protein
MLWYTVKTRILKPKLKISVKIRKDLNRFLIIRKILIKCCSMRKGLYRRNKNRSVIWKHNLHQLITRKIKIIWFHFYRLTIAMKNKLRANVPHLCIQITHKKEQWANQHKNIVTIYQMNNPIISNVINAFNTVKRYPG